MRTVPPRDAVASFDSASAFVHSLAAALRRRDFPHLGQSRAKVPLVRAAAALPEPLRRRAFAVATGLEGIRPQRLAEIDMDRVAGWIADRYPARRYPAVLLGASNGALTHLAAACGVPWLPQTLLVPVRRGPADPHDVASALRFGVEHGPKLLAPNPGIGLHHMHDANQDELSGSRMAYFRTKWLRLPAAYERFLRERLEPGAPVVVVDDRSRWPVTGCGDRHVFQVGAQGGMTPEEYLATPGAPSPDDVAPEAEWGLSASLAEAVHDWAGRHGHPVVGVAYDHPQHPAAPVAEVMRAWLRASGRDPTRLLVSSFVVHDPWRTITTGSVPFWTFFPVESAAADLAAYLDRASYDDIDVLLFNHGTRSRGLAGADRWQRLADRAVRRGRLIGVDPDTFPTDFTAFVRYAGALRSLPTVPPPATPLTVPDALDGLAASARVTVEHRAAGRS